MRNLDFKTLELKDVVSYLKLMKILIHLIQDEVEEIRLECCKVISLVISESESHPDISLDRLLAYI